MSGQVKGQVEAERLSTSGVCGEDRLFDPEEASEYIISLTSAEG